MNQFIRLVVGLIAGLAVAAVLVVAVELLSALAHPLPEGFQGSHEEMCRHVENFPDWFLAGAVVAWALTATAATWTAGRIGHRLAAAVVAALLVAAVILNLALLPYPAWFKVACVVAIPLAGLTGYWLSNREPSADRGT